MNKFVVGAIAVVLLVLVLNIVATQNRINQRSAQCPAGTVYDSDAAACVAGSRPWGP